MDHWHKRPSYLDQAVSFAFDLDKRFPEAKILSLGQSPAWIVHGVGKIRKIEGEHANVGYLPFTGGFFTKEGGYGHNPNVMHFFANDKKYPSQEKLKRYLDYYSLYKNTPRQILEQADKGEKVILTEMINSAAGLASFLSAWTSQEDSSVIKELVEAIKIYAYDTMPNTNKDGVAIHNLDGRVHTFPLRRQKLSFKQADIMQNTSSVNEREDTSSRLVPIFRLSVEHKVQEEGLGICKNRPMVKAISGAIYNEIKLRI